MSSVAIKNTRKPRGSPTFETELRGVVDQLSAALRSLLVAIPGTGSIQRPAELKRALGIGTTLAWQVFRAANASESLIDAGNVPGRGAMKKVFDAAARRKVPPRLIAAAADALDAFHELVRSHAGDRTAFGSMVSDLASSGTDQIDVAHRRAAFKAQSHIWGSEVRAMVNCLMLHPGKDDVYADGIFIHGMVGIRQLRRMRPIIVSRSRAGSGTTERSRITIDPLDPAAASAFGISLLPKFCSQPIPTMNASIDSTGAKVTGLINGDIGNAGAATVFLADVYRNANPRFHDGHNQKKTEVRMSIRSPMRVSILDLLICKGTFGNDPLQVRSEMYSGLLGTEAPLDENDALPTGESIVHLGQGLHVLACPDVPRYPEILQYAADRVGWDGDQFDVYRYRVEYPVMPSIGIVQFDLPEKLAGQAERADLR